MANTTAAVAAAVIKRRNRIRRKQSGAAARLNPDEVEKQRLNAAMASIISDLKIDAGELDVGRYNRHLVEHRNGWTLTTVIKLAATFRCSQCSGQWSSVRCSFTFGHHTAKGGLPVVSRLWKQDCKKCGRAAYPAFRMDWWSERMVRVLGICAGRDVPYIDRTSVDPNEHKRPHMSAECERCQNGLLCSEATAAD